MIRTFLFDMGNVLLHFSHQKMCRQIGELCNASADEIHQLLFDSGLQLDFERGRYSKEEFHALVNQCRPNRGANVEFGLEDFMRASSDIFELNAPMLPVLDALKVRGHRLLLLSNTSIAHVEFIQRQFDLLHRFDDFILSYEAGATKPDPAIYAAALEKIDCDPTECFYTDDIAEYVAAGRSHGFHAEVFSDARTLIGQLENHAISLECDDNRVGGN